MIAQDQSKIKFSTLATSPSSCARGLKSKVESENLEIASKWIVTIEKLLWTRKSDYPKDILSISPRSTSKSTVSENSSMSLLLIRRTIKSNTSIFSKKEPTRNEKNIDFDRLFKSLNHSKHIAVEFLLLQSILIIYSKNTNFITLLDIKKSVIFFWY